ncbi:MAG: DUF1905 domain-containing protein [Sphingomonadales bacterium]|nr:DUF1905 domain-containing protein [Sphingomonadales bacterium]MDE2568419.1 DUF1905 domain-containing protein [Sphingomonadales bacterium]
MTLRQAQGNRELVCHTGPLWRWTGQSGTGTWHFLTIGGAAGEQLSATALMRRLEGVKRGWGSLKVTVTLGESRWTTSVFPQKDDGHTAWLLPVKLAVRKAEDVVEGDEVTVRVDVL